jgi:hypothetical protein
MRPIAMLAAVLAFSACAHPVPWKTALSEDDVLLDLAKRRADAGDCAKAFDPLARIARGAGDGSAAGNDEFWRLVSGCVSSYMNLEGGEPDDPQKALELCGFAARMKGVDRAQRSGVAKQCWSLVAGWTFTLFEKQRIGEAVAFCRSAHALAGSPVETEDQAQHWDMCLRQPDRVRAKMFSDVHGVAGSVSIPAEEAPSPRTAR